MLISCVAFCAVIRFQYSGGTLVLTLHQFSTKAIMTKSSSAFFLEAVGKEVKEGVIFFLSSQKMILPFSCVMCIIIMLIFFYYTVGSARGAIAF